MSGRSADASVAEAQRYRLRIPPDPSTLRRPRGIIPANGVHPCRRPPGPSPIRFFPQYAVSTIAPPIPTVGQVVRCRGRAWLVDAIEPSTDGALLSLSCLEDDSQGEQARAEAERLAGLPAPTRRDDGGESGDEGEEDQDRQDRVDTAPSGDDETEVRSTRAPKRAKQISKRASKKSAPRPLLPDDGS